MKKFIGTLLAMILTINMVMTSLSIPAKANVNKSPKNEKNYSMFKGGGIHNNKKKVNLNISSEVTSNSIKILWDSVDAAESYEIEVDGKVINTGLNNSFTHEGLMAKSKHTYRVKIISETFIGQWSELFEVYTSDNIVNREKTSKDIGQTIDKNIASINKVNIPSVPLGVKSYIINSSIILSWESVDGAVNYEIEVDGIIKDVGSKTLFIDSDLKAGTLHNYRVRAMNSSGNSEWSNCIEQKVSGEYISAPKNITGISTTSYITISWDEITEATGYDIEVDGVIQDNGSFNSYVHKDLEESSIHIYRVRAKKDGINGNWSKLFVESTLKSEKDVSILSGENNNNSEISISDIENGKVKVSNNIDTKSDLTGDSKVDEEESQVNTIQEEDLLLEVEYSPQNISNKANINKTADLEKTEQVNKYYTSSADSTSLLMEDSEENTIDVQTEEVEEKDPKDDAVEIINALDMPGNIKTVASNKSIVLTWDEVLGATGYDIEVDGVQYSTNVTTYIDDELEPGIEHSYRIRAKNANSMSDWSQTVTMAIPIEDMNISSNLTLSNDIICNNLNLNAGTLNLNGYKLTVIGSFNQNGGTININSGSLIVDKDYAITGWSILQMNTGDGYVLVNGSFKTSSYSSEQGYLTTGRLEVKGNITQVAGGNGQQYNFYQSGSFKLIISGDEVSTVTIANVDNSPFNIIDTSKSEGVKFQTAIKINKIEGLQNIIDGVTIQNSNIIVDKDEIVNCNLSLNGVTLNLNGHKLTVVGNLNQNSTIININSGSLIIDKDYAITGWSILQMNTGDGYVLVNGSFKTSSYSSEQGYLTTGRLEVKGNITQVAGGNGQQYNFYQSGSFKLIISGDEVSTVTITNVDNSPFNIIDTSKSAGVKFQTTIRVSKIEGFQNVIDGLTIQNSNIVLDNDEIVNCELKLYNSSVKLDGYEFIVMGNLTLLNSSIDLNGNELSVYKSFYQKDGTVNVNGGSLYIGEDYIIQGTSRLNMTNEWDYVYVTGDFKTSTSLSHQGYLSNGILEVMGDFTQEGNAYSFATSGNHEVILSGSEIQTVHFQNPQTSYFSNIDTKYSAGINCTYNVNYNVISLISSLSGSSFILDIIDTLDALGIDNIISLLNIATNIFMNENGMQYITKEDIGKFVLGICDAIDDNVLLGLGQKISALFDKFSPYDDLYYMYGKVFGDEIFLASFIYIGGAAAIDAATAFGLAAGSAGLGLALSETGIGFVVGEGVAAVALVDALAATVVSALCAVGVANSGIVLSEDIQKLEDLKKESSKVTEGDANSKIIDDIISGTTETTNGKGVARNFEKSGGFDQTLKDFESLNPANVKEIQTQYGPGKVGTLSDGTTVVARPGSTTGGATLEVKVSNSKVYKIRY